MNARKEKFRKSAQAFLKKKAEHVQLNEGELSKLWNVAVTLYSVSLPLIFVAVALFYFTDMGKDILCQLASNGFEASNEYEVY